MPRVFLFLLIMLIVMNAHSQKKLTDRKPVVAGRFYPADKEALYKEVMDLFKDCVKVPVFHGVRAIICPHAGYIFSGKTAASAFSAINKNIKFENIFIIGSSHVMAFNGASVYNEGDFLTPLGRINVNFEITDKLKREYSVFNFPVNAHLQEHSLEVQLPFIQYYFTGDPKIVPIIIGTSNINIIKKIAEILKPWFVPGNLFIISSDFSHYPSYKNAKEVDNLTANSIVSADPENFLETLERNSSRNIPGLATSMCGWTSGLLLLYLAEGDDKLEFQRIAYFNSGDSPYGNKDEVVGYHAIVLSEKNTGKSSDLNMSDNMKFSDDEKDMLLSLARDNIKSILSDNKEISVDEKLIPENCKKPFGAFVTLKIKGKLRGCIGKFISSEPLYEVVIEASRSAAFEDPRFKPLTKEEFINAELEISVLGPLKKIEIPDEIILGKHGILIKKDFRSGTMLPQVATENNWSIEEFLGYTSRDKAGLGWDGWKDAEIFIYEGIVLEETRK